MYTKEQVIQIIDALLQYPDHLRDAIENEYTDWTAEELFDLALNYTS